MMPGLTVSIERLFLFVAALIVLALLGILLVSGGQSGNSLDWTRTGCESVLRKLRAALVDYKASHGSFPRGEGARVIQELVRHARSRGYELAVRCVGVTNRGDATHASLTDYAGPSRYTFDQVASGHDPVIFADANAMGWNHDEGVVFGIRMSGHMESFDSRSVYLDGRAEPAGVVQIGTGSRIIDLRDLRRE